MKKVLLPLIALLVLSIVSEAELSAQITQNEADLIIQERMSGETKPFTVYAKEGVQTDFAVVTATGEILELGYSCWVYYVSYARETIGKYLIVKENNGNLLEVNTKEDGDPENLEDWRLVLQIVYYTEYSLSETLCLWGLLIAYQDITIINSNEELEQYISCAEGAYPEIDFVKQSLILAHGNCHQPIVNVGTTLRRLSEKEYQLDVELLLFAGEWPFGVGCTDAWTVALLTNKLDESNSVTFNRIVVTTSCLLKNLNYPVEGELLIINSDEELKNHIDCPDDNIPEIDFSKHTLLLANGYRYDIDYVHESQLIKTEEKKYDFYIRLRGNLPTYSTWIHKILIDKLSSDTIISLILH